MKWLFVLLLALVIFGGAAWFGYNTFIKEDIAVKKEQRGEVTPAPVPDISLPEFQAATQLRQEGKLTETRDSLIGFIQKYPTGKPLDEAKLPGKQPAKISAKVAETMAWKDGKRVGVGSKEYLSSTRWVRLAGAAGYTLYSVPDSAHPNLDQPPPPVGLGLAASDLEELSSLVKNGMAVTITD